MPPWWSEVVAGVVVVSFSGNPTLDAGAGGWQLHCWAIFYIHLLVVEQNLTPFHFISIESHD